MATKQNYEDEELEQVLKNRKKKHDEEAEKENEKLLMMMTAARQLPPGALNKAAEKLEQSFNNENACPFNLKNLEKNEGKEELEAEFDEGQIAIKAEGNQLKMEATGFENQDKKLAGVIAKGTKVILDAAEAEPAVAVEVSNAPNEKFQDNLKESLVSEEVKVLDSKQPDQTEDKSEENSVSSENDSASTYKTPTLTPPINPQG